MVLLGLKMLVLYIVLLFFSTCFVKSDNVDNQIQCTNNYMDMDNKPITDIEDYCNTTKTCLVKCCSIDEILDHAGNCSAIKLYENVLTHINYNKINIYIWDGTTVKKSKEEKIFVQNKMMSTTDCTGNQDAIGPVDFYVLQDGSLKLFMDNSWFDLDRWRYCVDFQLHNTSDAQTKTVFKYSLYDEVTSDSIFSEIIRLISCTFILLVLLVYGLLPELRNLVGLVLMAYVGSLYVAYLIQAIIILCNKYTTNYMCKIISPIMYFALLSSFFWLNIMSFDIWRAFRGICESREIHRKSKLVKFKKYCIYAWGIPLLMSLTVITLDNVDLSKWHFIVKPSFDSCFADDKGVLYYLNIPLGILTIINIVLFFMTIYNIWIIKHNLRNCGGLRKNNIEKNRFITSIKLSLLMGVSWGLDFIPETRSPWIDVSINFYNAFIGVTIFYTFVFKKSILIKLCKKFNIKSKFVRNLQESQYTTADRMTRGSTIKSSMQTSHKHNQENPIFIINK